MGIERFMWMTLGMVGITAGFWITDPTVSDADRVTRRFLADAQKLGDPQTNDDSHMHAPIPESYANANIPTRVWTEPKMLVRGREVFESKCVRCHGEQGDGNGSDAGKFALKPADLTDARTVAAMAGNYWFWRVSEGGKVEPFKSRSSKMPAWKDELSVVDRWAVIAYAHTLSGHQGPHTASEHPEIGGGHGGH